MRFFTGGGGVGPRRFSCLKLCVYGCITLLWGDPAEFPVAEKVEGLAVVLTLKGNPMKPDPTDSLLADYARQALPPPPEGINADVWGEIERRRHRTSWSRVLPLLEWRELFGEPRLAATAMICALAVGVLPAVMWSKSQAEQRLARQSMHFEVFSASSATQLATLTGATTRGHN